MTPWTVAHQPSLSMGFSRQEYWSGFPCPPPGDLPNPGIEPRSPALQADSLPSEPLGMSGNVGLNWRCREAAASDPGPSPGLLPYPICLSLNSPEAPAHLAISSPSRAPCWLPKGPICSRPSCSGDFLPLAWNVLLHWPCHRRKCAQHGPRGFRSAVWHLCLGDHALIMWLSFTDHTTDHTLITRLHMH